MRTGKKHIKTITPGSTQKVKTNDVAAINSGMWLLVIKL